MGSSFPVLLLDSGLTFAGVSSAFVTCLLPPFMALMSISDIS